MIRPSLILAALVAAPLTIHAQTRAFLVRLGSDTFAIERFTRAGNAVTGAVVRHTPSTTVLRYSIVFRPDSTIQEYREDIFNADGVRASPSQKMTFTGDTVVREVLRNGSSDVRRDAVSGIVLPAVGGTSPYWQELALQAVRRAHDTAFTMVNFASGPPATVFAVRLLGADSAEIPIGGQGFHRGYRTDRLGRLVHGDASSTTVRLQMTPIQDADIDAIAHAWAAKDAAGEGMGTPSTRDTVLATLGTANVSIDYGRPAKRGRVIWGKLVPFDTVWRLGANLPTVLTTSKPLDVGGSLVRAGSYSLWLVPSAGQSYLLVNRQTAGWVGVPMHDASQDMLKIPVRRHTGSPRGEDRFRIRVENGTLMMLWDDGGFDVAIRPAPQSANVKRLQPYANAWTMSFTPDTGRSVIAPILWEDRLDSTSWHGHPALRRTQVEHRSAGVATTVNIFDPATMLPYMSEQHRSDGLFWRYEFTGHTASEIRSALRPGNAPRQPEGAHIDTVRREFTLSTTPFDFFGGMYGLLLPAVKLQRGGSGTFPALFQATDSVIDVHYTVTGRERVSAGGGRTVDAWTVETPLPGGGRYTFWISEDPPYIMRLTSPQAAPRGTWSWDIPPSP